MASEADPFSALLSATFENPAAPLALESSSTLLSTRGIEYSAKPEERRDPASHWHDGASTV